MSRSVWKALFIGIAGGLVVYWLTKGKCSCAEPSGGNVA